ncbi:MAG: hypothetical protein Q9187_002875 [Circinaria calcarea]
MGRSDPLTLPRGSHVETLHGEDANLTATSGFPESDCTGEGTGDSLVPSAVSPSSPSKDRRARMHPLDLPTSLLVITCYINLVRLCRSVFSTIRRCLLTLDRQAVFATLSDLQISGISLQQDGNLQILVLIQVVICMLDRIGSSMGYPKGYSISGGQRDEEAFVNEVVTPKLMDLVMREEELNGQGTHGGGIKAFREEIRKLRTMLDQT